jgi:hypothetical protein
MISGGKKGKGPCLGVAVSHVSSPVLLPSVFTVRKNSIRGTTLSVLPIAPMPKEAVLQQPRPPPPPPLPLPDNLPDIGGTPFSKPPDPEEEDEETFASLMSPVVWLSLAWFASLLYGWITDSNDTDWWRESQTPPMQLAQMPKGHPPVPKGARDLCTAGLAAAAAAGREASSWLESNSAVAFVTVVLSVVVGVRRWRIETARAARCVRFNEADDE